MIIRNCLLSFNDTLASSSTELKTEEQVHFDSLPQLGPEHLSLSDVVVK